MPTPHTFKGSVAIVGTPWGDEGKGKVVDTVAADADAVVRYHGGGNAGHTLLIDGRKIVTHILPVGIARPGMMNLVGPYVVCDPETLTTELAIAQEFGSKVFLDRQAPVVLPIHKVIDQARESASTSGKIGTTGRGIGPCYEDWVSRRGVSLEDLTDDERLLAALTKGNYYTERCAVARHHGGEPQTIDDVLNWSRRFGTILTPHLDDTRARISRLLEDRRHTVVFEGAQGILLDVGLGRPFATSSFCTPAAASTSLGVPAFDHIIGVAKAYTTRVGNGPFPTEVHENNGWLNSLRQRGDEYGATTGRPRRCGFLDIPLLRFTCRVAGIRQLVITKLDVLTGHPTIPVCEEYTLDGAPLDPHLTLTPEVLGRVKTKLALMEGWTEDLSACHEHRDLPQATRDYLAYIESALRIPVIGVGVGPGREQFIWF